MILVVDNYDSFTWNLVMLLRAAAGAGADVRVVYNDAHDLAALRAMGPSHVVVSPGPGAPRDAGVSRDVVRAPFAPVLGVCLGHQCLAEAFGATVSRGAVPVHGKASRITHRGVGLFEGIPQGFLAARYHSLAVVEATVRPPLAVTARADDGAVMALRCDGSPLVGVQFHPESVLTEHGLELARNFLSGRW